MKPAKVMRKLRFDKWIVTGVILILLAVFTAGQGWYFLHKQSQTIECQTHYNQAFLEALKARSSLTERDRANNEEFIASWEQPTTPEEARAAAIKYLETKAEIDAERDRFPLPPLLGKGRC